MLVRADRTDGIHVPVNPPYGNLFSPHADECAPSEREVFEFAYAYLLHTHFGFFPTNGEGRCSFRNR